MCLTRACEAQHIPAGSARGERRPTDEGTQIRRAGAGRGRERGLQFLQLVIAGLSQGCIYGLIALGFVLIYKATETVNFAQGELVMLGAFAGFFAATVLAMPYWAALIFAVIVAAIGGAIIERVALRPILGQPAFAIVMVTIGLGYMARGLVTMIPNIGTETHALPAPFPLSLAAEPSRPAEPSSPA